MKKQTKILFLILLIIAVFFFVFNKFLANSGINKNVNSKTQNQRETNIISAHLANKKPFSTLLLGYGGGNHDGAYLTDSMMVVEVNPSSKNIALISIPRDIWVNIPVDSGGGKNFKINTAYAIGMDDKDYPDKPSQFKGRDGAGNMAEAVVGTVTGFKIDRFVAADFDSFAQAIDTLGGVDVYNDQTFDDYAYPIDGKENDLCGKAQDSLTSQGIQASLDILPTVFPCRYEHIHYDQGMIHLDGTDALKFVRSRHSEQEGSDFARSARQRNLITALRSKVLSLGIITKILPLYQSLSGHLSTDFSLEEIKSFLTGALEFSNYSVKSISMTDQNTLAISSTDDGQYILVPQTGKDKWDSIHSWLTAELNKSNNTDEPIVRIINGTGITGLAASEAGRLTDKKIAVTVETNSSSNDTEKTTVTLFDKKLNQDKLKEIEAEFHAKAVLSDRLDNSLPYNVLVVIGKDFDSSK